MQTEQTGYTRAYLIKGACEGLFTGPEVAKRLGLSLGRVDQIKRKYRQIGDKAFVHGNKGRVPVNKISDAERQEILELKTSELYYKANFRHFLEILCEDKGIKRSYSAVRKILIGAGHKSPKKRRTKKQIQIHSPRPRRESFGEMLQGDASPFDWLRTGENLALHGYIDDATSAITGLFLEKNECLLGYLEVTRQTVENYGIPMELYPDMASVFFLSEKKQQELTTSEQLSCAYEKKTQLGLIMDNLGVDMHPAHSAEAKGRVERLWETLQSRLPIEFRRRGITTIEEANIFLSQIYIQKYNAQFAVKPVCEQSRFIQYFNKSELDILLTVKIQRKTDYNGIFSFHNHKFIVNDPACRGKKIHIVMSEKIGFKAMPEGSKKVYDIQYCDFFDNKHTKTHMPEVTKIFLDKYLRTPVKETTKSETQLYKKISSW